VCETVVSHVKRSLAERFGTHVERGIFVGFASCGSAGGNFQNYFISFILSSGELLWYGVVVLMFYEFILPPLGTMAWGGVFDLRITCEGLDIAQDS